MKYLAGLVVSLFCFGYWVCNFFYENGSVEWWQLRLCLYSIIFALCFYIGYRLTSEFTKAIFLVGIVFCLGDIADRYLFAINEFNINDLLLYIFAIYYLTKSHYAREIKTDS